MNELTSDNNIFFQRNNLKIKDFNGIWSGGGYDDIDEIELNNTPVINNDNTQLKTDDIVVDEVIFEEKPPIEIQPKPILRDEKNNNNGVLKLNQNPTNCIDISFLTPLNIIIIFVLIIIIIITAMIFKNNCFKTNNKNEYNLSNETIPNINSTNYSKFLNVKNISPSQEINRLMKDL